METEVHTFRYENGLIQKVQSVRLDRFEDLHFFSPSYSKEVFHRICSLYRDFIIKKYAWLFGKVVIYELPEDVVLDLPDTYEEHGQIFDPLAILTIQFEKHIKVKNGKLVFTDEKVREIFERLKEIGSLCVAEGKRNSIFFLPVSRKLGLMSESFKDAKVKVNSSFFVMDLFDRATVYDQAGFPVGLRLENGRVLSPPLFDREVLMVEKKGKVKISRLSIKDLSVVIDGIEYRDGLNASFYSRPGFAVSDKGGFDIVICDDEVMAVKKGGQTAVPASGFVMKVKEELQIKDRKVSYRGFDDLSFAIQVGNSAIVDGKKTERFLSPFYNFLRPSSVAYPPSMYPLNYKKARAPRIILGSDKDDRPVFLWIEGAGKFGYVKGRDSCGASLSEAAEICEKLGLINAIHLDGGGSAQILIDNKRQLLLSDRDQETYSEIERGIPVGLYL